MAVFLHVVFVDLMPGMIHVLGVPIALFGLTLWTPVRPDAEFGVAIPVGDAVVAERFAGAFEGAGSDFEGFRGRLRRGALR